MNVTCAKCGAPVSADQAFCPKCGAVQGATHQRRESAGFDMAATMVGQKFPGAPPPAPKPPPPAAATPPTASAPPPQAPQAPSHGTAPVGNRVVSPAPTTTTTASGNRTLYLFLGLFAALVLGGLLAFFVYVIFGGV